MKISDAINQFEPRENAQQELIASAQKHGFADVNFPENLRIEDGEGDPEPDEEYIEYRNGVKVYLKYSI